MRRSDQGPLDSAAEAAIARVLGAESAARADIEAARLEIDDIADEARKAARALGDRTERRIRALTAAFERESAAQLAAIEAEAARLLVPHVISPEQLADLGRQVRAVARSCVGLSP